MHNKFEFGECLGIILSALDIKGSRLAKAINIDSSLVNRWINGSRIPSYNSNYVKLISKYINSSITNSFQEKVLCEALNRIYHVKKCEKIESLYDKIVFILAEAQGYSIEKNKINQSDIKSGLQQENAFSLFSMDWKAKSINDLKSHANPEIEMLLNNNSFPNFNSTKNLFSKYTAFETRLILGEKDVLECMLNLIKTVSDTKSKTDSSIFITYNSDEAISVGYGRYNNLFKMLISNAIKNGWQIISLVKISNNTDKVKDILDYLRLFGTSGKFIIYYFNKYYSFTMCQDMIVIPGIAAMQGFSEDLNSKWDCAFYYENIHAVNILSNYFSQLISIAQPLFRVFNSQKHKTLKFITELEERYGDRYILKHGLSSLTIPMHIYKKFLRNQSDYLNVLNDMEEYHNRRMKAFILNIKHFKYKDICTKEAIERLVLNKEYFPAEEYLFKNQVLTNENIKEQLQNTIDMLEKYANYEIVFMSEKDIEFGINYNIFYKDKVGAFSEQNKSDLLSESFDSGVISEEQNLINTVGHYFYELWAGIPSVCKDKKEVIAWLKSMIEIID